MNACAALFKAALDEKKLYSIVSDGEDGDVLIDFPYNGKIFRCVFGSNDGKYFSLYLNYEHIPDEKVADMIFLCNELNIQYKWFTFYVDRDKDLMLHGDAILTIENAADEALELLIRALRMSEDVKARVMKTIYA